MLKQRVMTALVLFAVLAATLLAPTPWPLIALLTLMSACALWEWLRLSAPPGAGAVAIVLPLIAAVAFIVMAAQWTRPSPALLAVQFGGILHNWLVPAVSLVWVVGATAMVLRGRSEQRRHGVLLSLFGTAAIVSLWTALVALFLAYGAWFLVSLMALIWFADTAAYFTGKAFGRHKLAPRVSPGKTWEGAAGGIVAASAWVMLSAVWPGSFGAVLAQRWPWWTVLLIAAFLAAMSIVGDLFESLLKRRAGVKDSSQLLPGHGGVYDRIDALLPVAPIALMLTGAGI